MRPTWKSTSVEEGLERIFSRRILNYTVLLGTELVGWGEGNEICVWSLLLSISINNIWVFIFRFLLWCLSIWVFLFGASFLGLCFQGLFFYLKIGVYSLRPGGVSFWNPLSTGVWLYTLSLLERLKLELDISGEKP